MCRVLIKIVFPTAFLVVSAPALAARLPAVPPPETVAVLNAQHGPERISATISTSATGGAPYRSTAAMTPAMNPASAQMVPAAYRGADEVGPMAARNPTASPASLKAGQDDAGWRYGAALLSTLALIGTIALRRHEAGKPGA